MDCDQALEHISAALDGELTGSALAGLKAHLASCPDCRALYEELREIQAGLLASTEDPPEGFHDRLMAAVAAEPMPVVKQNSRRRAWTAVAAAAAVAALVLLPQWNGISVSNGAPAPMMAAPAGGSGPAADGAESAPAEGQSTEDFDAPADGSQEKNVFNRSALDNQESGSQNDVMVSSAMTPDLEPAAVPFTADGASGSALPRGAVVTVAGELPEGYAWDGNGTLELAVEELPQLEAALTAAGIPYTVEDGSGAELVLVVRGEPQA